MEQIIRALANQGIEAKRFESTINARFGDGIHEHRVNLLLPNGLEEDSENSRLAFARGVRAVLSESPRSRAGKWSFEQSAGRLFPSVESHRFAEGVRAASGSLPFAIPLSRELEYVFYIEADQGRRILTQHQAQTWGVTEDRIYSAARSMLFHRTRNLKWESCEGPVLMVKAGDGYEAARGLVFSDAYFAETTEDFRVAIPETTTYLFVKDSSAESVDALKSLALKTFNESSSPLSTAIFALRGDSIQEADH